MFFIFIFVSIIPSAHIRWIVNWFRANGCRFLFDEMNGIDGNFGINADLMICGEMQVVFGKMIDSKVA